MVTPYPVLPDPILVVRELLVESTDVTALVAAARIGSRQPASTSQPFVVLGYGGNASDIPMRADRADIAISAFVQSDTPAMASTIIRTIRAVVLGSRNIVLDTGVYLSGIESVGVQQLPDDRQPPLQRLGFTVTVLVR